MFRLALILLVSFEIWLASSSPTENDKPFETSENQMIEDDEGVLHFMRLGNNWAAERDDDPAFVQDYHAKDYDKPLPKNFDAREAWSKCPAISQAADQGDCQSCWAVASSDVIRDRVCIKYANMTSYTASASELINCVPKSDHDACLPGLSIDAMHYFVDNGIVTGGPYDSGIGCKPYQIHPNYRAKSTVPSVCESKCANPEYPISYQKDKKFGKNARIFNLGPNIIKDIQLEIFHNGPVVASLHVYASFLIFWRIKPADAVYRKYQIIDKFIGGHAVRLVGWGSTPDGVDYWTFVNSWGNDSRRHGVGRILRGVNECNIEGRVTTVDVCVATH